MVQLALAVLAQAGLLAVAVAAQWAARPAQLVVLAVAGLGVI
jgi:hypothetical protein